MVLTTNSTTQSCRLFDAMSDYLYSQMYGIECPDDCVALKQAKEAYMASFIIKYQSDCSIPEQLDCILKDYILHENNYDCEVVNIIDYCFNSPDLNISCNVDELQVSPIGNMNGTVVSDVIEYSTDGITWNANPSNPILIGDDCSYITHTSLIVTNPATSVQVPETDGIITFTQSISSNDRSALQSYYDNSLPTDILEFIFYPDGGTNYVIKEYKYKLTFILTNTQLQIGYDPANLTFPMEWCETQRTALTQEKTTNEANWNWTVSTPVTQIKVQRFTPVFPTTTYYFRRTINIQESECDDIVVNKTVSFGQDLCDDLTICENENIPNSSYNSLEVVAGDTVNLNTYLTESSVIEQATFSPSNTPAGKLINGSLNTTGMQEGLYIYQQAGECNSYKYVYVNIQSAFKVQISGSSESVCPNGDFNINFQFTGGDAPFKIRYNIDTINIKEPTLTSDGTITENFTSDAVVTIESVVDGTGKIGILSGQTVYNVTVNTTDTSSTTVSSQTYNTTTGNIDWILTNTVTSSFGIDDITVIRIKDSSGTVLAEADFIRGASTMHSPRTDISNWNVYSSFFTDNIVGVTSGTTATTNIEFDKLSWAVATSTLGIGLGENLVFEYEFQPDDVCISSSSTSHIIDRYKTPISFNVNSGTIPNQEVSCTIPYVYSPMRFAYQVKGIGSQNLSQYITLNPSTWSVTNDTVYDSDGDGVGEPCYGTAFTPASPSDFAPFTYDINDSFFYTTGNYGGNGPQLINIGQSNEQYSAIYNILFNKTVDNSSNIYNSGGSWNTDCLLQKFSVGTPTTPLSVTWNAPLSYLPGLESYLEMYVATLSKSWIPNIASVSPVNGNTFNFTFRLATGNSNGGNTPFAIRAGQLADNPITYNYARIKIENAPGTNSYNTINFTNSPITYTADNIITGGYNNSQSSGLNGIEEQTSVTFNQDGIYKIVVEAEASLADGNTYSIVNSSELLILSF